MQPIFGNMQPIKCMQMHNCIYFVNNFQTTYEIKKYIKNIFKGINFVLINCLIIDKIYFCLEI